MKRITFSFHRFFKHQESLDILPLIRLVILFKSNYLDMNQLMFEISWLKWTYYGVFNINFK